MTESKKSAQPKKEVSRPQVQIKKGRAQVLPWKVKKVEELVSLLKQYPVVGLVDLKGTPASHVQKLRHSMKDKFQMLITKKNLVLFALKKLGWEDMVEKVGDMPALIISKTNPFKLYSSMIKANTPAFAKPGQKSPSSIMIPKGPTSIPAGPGLVDFQKVNLPAKIQEGKIAIVKDTVIAKAGDPITDDIAAILKKLDVAPFENSINIIGIREGPTLYFKDVLAIDEVKMFNDFITAHSWAFNLAIESGYPCKDTIEVFLAKAFNEAKALAVDRALYEPEVVPDLLAMASRQAKQVGGEDVEYVYAAMLLHKSGHKVDEAGMTKVLEATGKKPDQARVKALVAALEGVNIDEAIKKAAVAAPVAAAPAAGAPAAEKKEEKKSAEEEKKSEEEAASGLAALFG